MFVVVFLQVEEIERRCLELFARDYKYSIIHNANGEVCGHYPRQIVFLEYESTDVESNRYVSTILPIHCFPIQSPVHSVTYYLYFVCVSALIMHTLLWCREQRALISCPCDHIKRAESWTDSSDTQVHLVDWNRKTMQSGKKRGAKYKHHDQSRNTQSYLISRCGSTSLTCGGLDVNWWMLLKRQ